jgi:membrane protease YdiL (CAAX protease family)
MSDLSIPEPVPYPQALDIQHDTDPEQDHGVARRIPHLGHAALFFGIVAGCFFLCLLISVGIVAARHPNEPTMSSPYIHAAAIGQLLGYALAFAIAFPVFPHVWGYSFLNGIHWTWRAVRLHWWKLMLLGVAVSFIAGAAEHLVKPPKDIEILKLLDTPLAAWLTAITGALIAPVVEEIAFRGFLLPAIATAYDWLSLDRTPAALMRWRLTTGHTPAALVLSALVTSAAFAGLHGFQLHWQFGPLFILFCVSLVFCAVRIRLRSVAASVMVHVTYNSVLFCGIIVQTGFFRHLDRLTSMN